MENELIETFSLSYPFNVHTLHGYFAYLIMVIIALHTYAILVTSQASFFLSSCFYLDAFTEDFDQQMIQLNNFEDKIVRSIDKIQQHLSDAIKFNIQIVKFVIV